MRTGRNVLLGMLIVVGVVAATAGMAATVGAQAPDFQLKSLTSGDTIRLSNNFDKPTVLVFWVSTCPHCRHEMPVIQNMYKDLGTKANFLGVSLDAQPEDALRVVKGMSVTFPNAFGNVRSDTKIARDYQVRGVPAVFVLDKGGKITARHDGMTSETVLREDLGAVGVR